MLKLPEGKLRTIMNILCSLINQRFWGEVTIKFKDGEPFLVQEQRQIKLSDD